MARERMLVTADLIDRIAHLILELRQENARLRSLLLAREIHPEPDDTVLEKCP